MHRKNLLEIHVEMAVGPIILYVVQVVVKVADFLHRAALQQKRDSVECVTRIVQSVLSLDPLAVVGVPDLKTSVFHIHTD